MPFILIAILAFVSPAPAADSMQSDTVRNQSVRSVKPKDGWFSTDKFIHFGASAGIVGLTYHTYVCQMKRDEEVGKVLSISVTGVAGLGKEMYDKIKKGHFCWKDLLYDGLGLGVGYLLFVR